MRGGAGGLICVCGGALRLQGRAQASHAFVQHSGMGR